MFKTLKKLNSAWTLTGEVEELRSRTQYLLNEVSELRQLVRHLLPESPGYRDYVRETCASFDYQWKNLNSGTHTIADKQFRVNGPGLLEKYSRLPRSWFTGKNVLDAGCGGGRWTWVLCSAGAQVTAIDQSQSCVEATQQVCQEFQHLRAFRHSLLENLKTPAAFDLVWSYGVVHHTGYTFKAVQHLAETVKSGGWLFLMVYGEPRWEEMEDYDEVNSYTKMRRELAGLSFEERVQHLQKSLPAAHVHGWFDAASPRINDLHRFDEIAEWLRLFGFTDIQQTFPNRNLHIVARKK